MATYSKPVDIPRWADTSLNVVEPAEAKKDAGWVFEEIPPSSYENWKAKLNGEWWKWVDERLDDGASADNLRIKFPLEIEDANYRLELVGAGTPRVYVDSLDWFDYVRATDQYRWYIASSAILLLDGAEFELQGQNLSGAVNVDATGDLTVGTITMTGFSVDADGDVVTKSINNSNGGITNTGAISGATSIDGTGDLTMISITMAGFAVDSAGNITDVGNIAGAGNIDGTGDLTMGTITMTGFSVDSAGNITDVGNISGAGNIDGTGDLTMGSITMTGFSLDSSGNILDVGNISQAGNIDGSGDLTMGTITMTGFSVDADGDVSAKSLNNSNGGITNAGAISGATSIDGSGDLTMGSITMTGFAVDSSGNITDVGSIAGATSIDGSGDLTMGTITMTGFSVDADGDATAKSLELAEGLVVGYSATPVADQVLVGDPGFALHWDGTDSWINFNGTPGGSTEDRIGFQRSGALYRFEIGGILIGHLDAGGLRLAGGLTCGNVGFVPSAGAVYAQNYVSTGVYYSSTKKYVFGVQPDNDYFEYNDTTKDLDFVIDGGVEYTWDNAEFDMHSNNLVNVNECGLSVLEVGDANYRLELVSDVPTIYFDHFSATEDKLYFDRSTNTFAVYIDGLESLQAKPTGVVVTKGLSVGDETLVPDDNDIYCQGTIATGAGLIYFGNPAVSDDYIQHNETLNWYQFRMDNQVEYEFGATAADWNDNDLNNVGTAVVKTQLTLFSDSAKVARDANYYFQWDTTTDHSFDLTVRNRLMFRAIQELVHAEVRLGQETYDGTNYNTHLHLYAKGAPSVPSTVASNAIFYSMISGGTAEMWVKDGAGNTTQLSPHDDDGHWIFNSINKNGIHRKVNMDRLVELVERLSGEQLTEILEAV